jgi:Fe-S-cluster containining protein
MAIRKRQSGVAGRDRRGRVHLRLQVDPVTGAEAVTLETAVFKESWQNELLVGAVNTARGILRERATVEGTAALARNVMAATSRLNDGLLARVPPGTVACKSGCDHCCYQSVGVTPPEALAIWRHLTATLSAAELAALAARIAEVHEQTRRMTSGERFSPEHPCPFLAEGCCSIYEVRPLACRGMNALDAGECATRLRDPDARAAFLAGGPGGRSFMEPIRAAHAVSAGLQIGLSELYQLDMRPLELSAAMHALFSGPESADGWVDGGRTFESAVRAEWATDAALRELSGALPGGDAGDPDRGS